MKKEIIDIVKAYKIAKEKGRSCALATVVHVEGSSYRRPGARMLLEDNGRLTGAISGGCLEGDAFRKAMLAIIQKQNKLVAYNSMDEDDIQFGVQLGCNGIVHILFEPVDPETHSPLNLLEACIANHDDTVITTAFSLKKINSYQPGTILVNSRSIDLANTTDQELLSHARIQMNEVFTNQTSIHSEYDEDNLSIFTEFVPEPISLNIVGAGNDAMPLVEIANMLGWQVTLIDGRHTHANANRFPDVSNIIVSKPEDAILNVKVNANSAFILMTHNYNYDLAVLRNLLKTSCGYIGTLGPKKKLARMINELEGEGTSITPSQRDIIYGPTGLDIGAETAAEIALSIISEIKAIFSNRRGASLREKQAFIHERNIELENKEI